MENHFTLDYARAHLNELFGQKYPSKFTPDDKMSSTAYFQIYDGGGFINDFTATNCTFWAERASVRRHLLEADKRSL